MVHDPRKHQKKVERQKAKKKEQQRQRARQQSRGLGAQLKDASSAPMLHCVVAKSVWDDGFGEVLFSRQLSGGNVACAIFLLDLCCLGVKDAFSGIVSRGHYDEHLHGKLREQAPFDLIKPECARKLVEGAVAYALDLGFAPHADYRAAKEIFGDVSAAACTQEFTYGRDGKPLYTSGPFDSPARIKEICNTLERRCGPGGYHYITNVNPLE